MGETWKALLVVLVLAGAVRAADPPLPVLEVIGPITAEVGKKCVIRVQTTAKKVTWKIPAGCDTENLDGRRLAVWALPGTYTFVAMVPYGDDVVSMDYVLTVTGPRPPPPPPPPPPDDPVLTPFQVKLQAAYRADGATLESKSKYAALWRNAAKTTVFDTGIATPGALLAELKVAVGLLGIPHGSLDKTARVVADELNPLMPKPANGTMTAEVRQGVATLFTRIATDLDAIGGK